MPAEDDSYNKPTLGQRIDALLGPLDQEAQAFREAIVSGRAQMAHMQARIDQAEQALAGIEEKMIRVLKTLATEEPMLALAMGAGDELPPGFMPTPPAPTAQTPPPPPALRAQAVQAAPTAPAPESAAPPESPEVSIPQEADAPPVVTLEKTLLPDADPDVEPFIMPTHEEDAAAVDEILNLLDAEPGLAAFDASPDSASPLADAAG